MSANQTPGIGTWISALLFFAGLGAGPGYWVYSKFYTGTPMESHEIRQAGTGYQAVRVALSPDMNPIGMAIGADYSYNWTNDKVAFIGVALDDGRTRLASGHATFEPHKDNEKKQTNLRVSTGGARSFKTVFLDTFSVPRADNYTFHFNGTRPDSSTVRIINPRLELRRNMKRPNMKIVWSGTGVLVFSMLLGWMTAPARLD